MKSFQAFTFFRDASTRADEPQPALLAGPEVATAQSFAASVHALPRDKDASFVEWAAVTDAYARAMRNWETGGTLERQLAKELACAVQDHACKHQVGVPVSAST